MKLYEVRTDCKKGGRRLLFKELADAMDYAKSEYNSNDYEEIWLTIWETTKYGAYGACEIDENFKLW